LGFATFRAMIRRIVFLAACALAGTLGAAEIQFDFGQFKLSEPPPGFRSTVSGTGKPGDWRVIIDDFPSRMPALTPSTPAHTKRAVLAQLATNPEDEHFPILIYEKESFGDFKVTTRFKTVSGAVEQMAGIVFRFQDEKNYYYVRASSLGNSFRFYKVVNGQRSGAVGQIIGRDLEIPRGAWHELSVACKGNNIDCLLDGKEVLPTIHDDSFISGKFGFWTKSDSVSYFVDTVITYTPRIILAQTLVNDMFRQYPRLLGLKVYSIKPQSGIQLIASRDEKEVGQAGGKVEEDVIKRSSVYYGKEKESVLVTLPLHDRNGETVAAVRVTMKSFPGQTEQNAIARALPVVKKMEAHVRSAQDLLD
jgi:hypothetical protein